MSETTDKESYISQQAKDITKSFEDFTSELKDAVYKAALVAERMESNGHIFGNGHHFAQEIAEYAEIQILKRKIVKG
jgi:hypothetical protein